MSPVIQSSQQLLKQVINFKSDLLVHIIQHIISSIISVPSAPPEGILVSVKMTFSITVEWQAVPCIHRNGNVKLDMLLYITCCVTLHGWIKSAAMHFILYKVRASRTVYTDRKLLQKINFLTSCSNSLYKCKTSDGIPR